VYRFLCVFLNYGHFVCLRVSFFVFIVSLVESIA